MKNGVATIGVETQILTPADDPKIRVQLMQKTSRGKIRFDVDAGRMIGQQLDLDERVLAFSGADSSMHYLTRFTEGPAPAEEKTAAKGVKAKPATSQTAGTALPATIVQPTAPALTSVMVKKVETVPPPAAKPAAETKTSGKSTTIK